MIAFIYGHLELMSRIILTHSGTTQILQKKKTASSVASATNQEHGRRARERRADGNPVTPVSSCFLVLRGNRYGLWRTLARSFLVGRGNRMVLSNGVCSGWMTLKSIYRGIVQ